MTTNKSGGRWMKTKAIYQNIYGSMKVVKLLKNQALYEVMDFIPGHYMMNGFPDQIEFWSIRKMNIPNKALIMRKFHKSDKPMVIEIASYYDDGVISDVDLVFMPGHQPTLVLKSECD
jgi:hypothetical protein